MIAITLGYGVIYTCRLALGVVKKPLIDAGIFGPAELGMIGSALFYTYAIGKLTNGFLADHANMKKFLAAGFVLTAICNIGMGFSTARGPVDGDVGTERLVPESRRARRRGGDDGLVQQPRARPHVRHLEHGALDRRGPDLPGRRHDRRGARLALGILVPGVFGLATAAMVYVLVQDRPRTLGLPTVAEWRNDHYVAPPPGQSVFATQLSILKIPAIWVLALSSATIYVTRYAINSWGVLYLQEERGYSLPDGGHDADDQHPRRHGGRGRVRLHLRHVVQGAPPAGEPAVRDLRDHRPADDLLRPDRTADAHRRPGAVRPRV